MTSPDSYTWKTTLHYLQEHGRSFVDVAPSFEFSYKVTFILIVLSILHFNIEYLFKILTIVCLYLVLFVEVLKSIFIREQEA